MKQSKKIEDNPLEKEEERKSCMLSSFHDTCILLNPPPFEKFLDPRLLWTIKKSYLNLVVQCSWCTGYISPGT